MVSTLEQMQVPSGTGPGVGRSKRPLFASRSKFQNNIINILGDMTCLLKSYPFGIALCSIVSIQNNVIPIG